MNVLIAVHHFPPNHVGGAELQAYRMAAWMRDHGHDVHVVCVEAIDKGEGNGVTYEDDVYDGLPVRRLSFNLAAAPERFRWTYDNPWIGEHLRGYLTQLDPDLLHLISGYLMSGSTLRSAMGVSRVNGRRIATVVNLIDFWFLCPRITLLRSNGRLCVPPFDPVTCARCLGEEKRRYRLPGRLVPEVMDAFWKRRSGDVDRIKKRAEFLRETLSLVDVAISNSQFLRRVFDQAGFPGGQIVFVRQGLDLPRLSHETLVKTPSESLRIGYMGQIAAHKGLHLLFDAVGRLPGAAVKVKAYGDVTRFPDYTCSLRRMARRDPRLHLEGTYTHAEVSQVLKGLDVVVVPSVWYENSPNVILEAFAHCTPVVASDLGGMAELVQHGVNGLVFEPGNAEALARQLRRLLNEAGLLAKLRNGIAPVPTVDEEMRQLGDIYEFLVSTDPTDPSRRINDAHG